MYNILKLNILLFIFSAFSFSCLYGEEGVVPTSEAAVDAAEIKVEEADVKEEVAVVVEDDVQEPEESKEKDTTVGQEFKSLFRDMGSLFNFKKWGRKKKSDESAIVDEVKEKDVVAETEVPKEDYSEAVDAALRQKSIVEQSMVRKGELALEQGISLYHQFEFQEALKYFEEARVYLSDDERVMGYLSKTRQVLGQETVKAKDVGDWIAENQRIANQELLIKVRFHKERGSELLNRAKQVWRQNEGSEVALNTLQEARYEYRRANNMINQLPAGENKEGEEDLIKSIYQEINALEASWKSTQRKIAELNSKDEAIRLSSESKDYDETRQKSLLSQARRLYLEKKYDLSENLCRTILSEWPKNADAKLILGKSIRKRDRLLFEDIRQKSEEEWKRNIEKIRDSSITYSEWLNFSKDWEEIQQIRGQVNEVKREEPEWMRQMGQRMKAPVKLFLPDNNLREAMQSMQEQTGINFNIDSNLDMDELTITGLQLDNVPADSALQLMLDGMATESPLIYQFRDELVYITNKENQNAFIRPKQILYDVTDLVTSFGENTIGEGEGLLTGATLSNIDEEDDTTEPLSTATLIEIIQEAIEPESWEGNGVNITEYEEGKILISQATLVHEKIQELLEMFRKQQKLQVSIEARFITSQDDDLFELGVEWKGLDEVPLEDSGDQVGSGIYSKRTNAGVDTRVASLLGSAGDDAVGGAPLFISENRNTEGMNFELSVLDPIRAGLAMHALDRKQTQKDLLRPRLTVLNNKQGYILNSEDTTYIREYESEQGYVTPEVAQVSSGELLVVRPTVSSDRRYINLELSPQITRLVELETRQVSLPLDSRNGGQNGGQNGGSRIVDVTIELPRLQVWQVQTRIQVPDGGVVFVGGRMGNVERKISRGVPVLSKIPLIGRLFRSDGEYVQLANLIISVRAEVLVFDELENQLN